MRRESLWDRLYLSGIDGRAAELAREGMAETEEKILNIMVSTSNEE